MAEPDDSAASYLEELAELLVGSRRARRRLCAEIRAHIEDAIEDAGEVLAVLERIGPPQEAARAWAARCDRQRSRRQRRLALVVACTAAASFLAVAQLAQGGRAVPGVSCPVSHVRYAPDSSVEGGLRLGPWIATTPAGTLHAHLFFYGATPWAKRHLLGARIFTTAKSRRVNPKVLWTSHGRGAGSTLLIAGMRIDGPGWFSDRYSRASGNQFPSYVKVPAAGCWRVTVKTGTLVGKVTFAAVDSP
jgi:hypothetical protein